MKARVLILVVALLATLCFVGCGGGAKGRVAVSGSVTINGEPVPRGTIAFMPTAGTSGPVSGGSIQDGKYSFPAKKGIMPGSYTVEIEAFKVERGALPDLQGNMVECDVKTSILPKEYAKGMSGKPEKELTAEVKKGKNTIDFALEGDVPESN